MSTHVRSSIYYKPTKYSLILPIFLRKNTKPCITLLAFSDSESPYYLVYPNPTTFALVIWVKVRKTARTRNRYNQVPHLSQDTKWKSNKITINITNKSQEVSPFSSGDHKAAINRRESMTNTRHK